MAESRQLLPSENKIVKVYTPLACKSSKDSNKKFGWELCPR